MWICLNFGIHSCVCHDHTRGQFGGRQNCFTTFSYQSVAVLNKRHKYCFFSRGTNWSRSWQIAQCWIRNRACYFQLLREIVLNVIIFQNNWRTWKPVEVKCFIDVRLYQWIGGYSHTVLLWNCVILKRKLKEENTGNRGRDSSVTGICWGVLHAWIIYNLSNWRN